MGPPHEGKAGYQEAQVNAPASTLADLWLVTHRTGKGFLKRDITHRTGKGLLKRDITHYSICKY